MARKSEMSTAALERQRAEIDAFLAQAKAEAYENF
jgi:hypothetical protein